MPSSRRLSCGEVTWEYEKYNCAQCCGVCQLGLSSPPPDRFQQEQGNSAVPAAALATLLDAPKLDIAALSHNWRTSFRMQW